MKPTVRHALMLALVGLSMSATGCMGDKDQQIKALNNDLQVKIAAISDLEQDLANSHQENTRLRTELTEKDAALLAATDALDRAQAELDRLRTGEEPTDVASGWQRTSAGDKIPLSSDVLFSPGSATLSAKGKAVLDRVAGDLQGTYRGLPVRVYGHTDGDPIKRSAKLWTDNLDLSANRAMAVTRYLISKGISPDNVETIAMGATQPVASNSSADGKAKNRRVEVMVIR